MGSFFVANEGDGTVTEISAESRALVRVISGAKLELARLVALARDSHGDLFVLGAKGPVSKIDATSGKLLATATGSKYGFDMPRAIAVSDGHVFVTNLRGKPSPSSGQATSLS